MRKLLWILLIIILILLLLFWLCRTGRLPFCKSEHEPPPWQTYLKLDTNYKHIPGDSTEEILVWRTPGSGDWFLSYWLDSIHEATHKEIKIVAYCQSCDSSLLLLTGEGIKTFIQSTSGGKGGGTTCTNPPNSRCSGGGTVGGGDTIYWCVNFPVEFKDSANSDNIIVDTAKYQIPSPQPPGTVNSVTTVAVFDTGVDTVDVKDYLYANSASSCLGDSANTRWNFVNRNNIVRDNYSSRTGHGQVVAHIIVDQVKHYASATHNLIKILPVKIHNENGESDLFSVLCGFAYAQQRQVQIINASFGYYAVKNMAAPSTIDLGAILLKEYIKHYLTKNNILLIAAAGNRNFIDNDNSLRTLYIKAGLPIPAGFRNLDSINFYPASLAADPELPNVISVTTAMDAANTTSPNQNYSKTVVDIGVNANLDRDGDYWFRNERMPNSYVRGSSYATPAVTGIACAFYNDIKGNLTNKDAVLNILLGEPSVGNNNTANGRVKKGIM